MNENTIKYLCQPGTGRNLKLDGNKLVADDGSTYIIRNGIPRFVDDNSYAEDFGTQWNIYKKTQLDSYTGTRVSRDRLERCLNGHIGNLRNKLVLEVGSGAGRFTEILLKEGAILHSCDLSSAVDANAENNGASENLLLVQANLESLPFRRLSYDYVICIGVVQHTPSPEATIKIIYDMVRPGGYLIIDHYLATWRWRLPPPLGYAMPVYRKLILSLPREKRLQAITRIVDLWFPIHWRFKDSMLARRLLPRLSPVAFYYPTVSLPNKEAYYEWALLDTHDSCTDYYKHLRTPKEIEDVLRSLKATNLIVRLAGNGVEAFCQKPDGNVS